ncbi:hypothetical protein [Mucilaginibacter polytrichastri]|uniref:Uncharacterized protein n=1 Tax=Mucilaginibacter polytrichastri TaxID=1302689 RepID=A0A1Q5ZW18_9SPHI|nr:hypothetical protein [Mucilaginibacter polytrichastri]OKS85898.1 hypothetical protein RG47T_1344 [Mucilaginibacter polytrichastri]
MYWQNHTIRYQPKTNALSPKAQSPDITVSLFLMSITAQISDSLTTRVPGV